MSCTSEGTPLSSHGTFATWGGVNIGMIRNFSVRGGRTSLVDITPADTTISGTGWNSRCHRKVGVGAIEPMSLSMLLWCGAWSISQNDRGDVRYLDIQGDWGHYFGDAILLDYSISGGVGDYAAVSVEFTLVGG